MLRVHNSLTDYRANPRLINDRNASIQSKNPTAFILRVLIRFKCNFAYRVGLSCFFDVVSRDDHRFAMVDTLADKMIPNAIN
jgi:hypothetical protein